MKATRSLLLPGLFTALAFVCLVGLGVWQLERLHEKEVLLARIAERLDHAPVALPAEPEWAALSPSDYDYRKVTLEGQFMHERELHFFSFIGTGERGDTIPGYLVFTPLVLDSGATVIVNRGFVPEALKDKTLRAAGLVEGLVSVTGLMRAPEKRGLFTPADNIEKNIYFTRDARILADAVKLPRVAPFTLDADQTPVPGGLPLGGQTIVSVPNNHLQYALTWFALALALLGVFIAFVRKARAQPA
jgi:surfeit locus 1 family protein